MNTSHLVVSVLLDNSVDTPSVNISNASVKNCVFNINLTLKCLAV